MPRPNTNAILAQYPKADQLLAAQDLEVERVLLRYICEYCADSMHPMVTRDLFVLGFYRDQQSMISGEFKNG